MLAKIVSALLVAIERELVPLLRNLARELAPMLKNLAKAAQALLEHSQRLAITALAAFENALRWLVDVAGELIARILFDNEASRAAFIAFWGQMYSALSAHAIALICMFGGSMLLWVGTVFAPLLLKYFTRRTATVFVSFNASREPDAIDLQSSLAARGLGTARVPYSPGAPHQDVLDAVADGIQRAHVMLCIPGQRATFVDNEVLAARMSRKAVVFLLSEEGGTLPNSADKRYPIFKLERARELRFHPLIEFVRYIGADFTSQLELSRRARQEAPKSVANRRGIAIFTLTLMAAAAYAYFNYKRSSLLTPRSPTPEDVRRAAAAAYSVLFFVVSSFLALMGEYITLVVISNSRQVRTQKKAALQVASATFSREDWLGLVPGLQRGSPMYDCLFETPALAHHEAHSQS